MVTAKFYYQYIYKFPHQRQPSSWHPWSQPLDFTGRIKIWLIYSFQVEQNEVKCNFFHSSTLTLPVAFLNLRSASSIRSLTISRPSPHGTTTRMSPKQTVTFIAVCCPVVARWHSHRSRVIVPFTKQDFVHCSVGVLQANHSGLESVTLSPQLLSNVTTATGSMQNGDYLSKPTLLIANFLARH